MLSQEEEEEQRELRAKESAGDLFKNRRPESVMRMMTEAQMQSQERFRGRFRGTKLVSASRWSKKETIRPEFIIKHRGGGRQKQTHR